MLLQGSSSEPLRAISGTRGGRYPMGRVPMWDGAAMSVRIRFVLIECFQC